MERANITAFEPMRLHSRTTNGWAIVERPSGAVASDTYDRLLLRMTEPEARDLAAAMTLALDDRREARAGGRN